MKQAKQSISQQRTTPPPSSGKRSDVRGSSNSDDERGVHETIVALNAYIERLSKDAPHDSRARPLMISALLRRGAEHSKLKAWDAAIGDFTRVRDEQASSAEERWAAQIALGAIAMERHQDEQALAHWSPVLSAFEQASPTQVHSFPQTVPLLYLYRAMLSGRLERYQDAIADCDRAERFFPNTAEICSVRGISYAFLDELDRALAECAHAVELEPTAACLNRLGEVYRLRNDHRQALDRFRQALNLEPENRDIQANWYKALFAVMNGLFHEEPGQTHDQTVFAEQTQGAEAKETVPPGNGYTQESLFRKEDVHEQNTCERASRAGTIFSSGGNTDCAPA